MFSFIPYIIMCPCKTFPPFFPAPSPSGSGVDYLTSDTHLWWPSWLSILLLFPLLPSLPPLLPHHFNSQAPPPYDITAAHLVPHSFPREDQDPLVCRVIPHSSSLKTVVIISLLSPTSGRPWRKLKVEPRAWLHRFYSLLAHRR